MSLTLNMVGGGSGGGISSNSALLVVYAPLGSIVTATSGGSSKTSRTGIVLSDDPTREMHLISIGSSQFGTWTVTATDGVHSATKSIEISSAKYYELSCPYELLLYRNGVIDTSSLAGDGLISRRWYGGNSVKTLANANSLLTATNRWSGSGDASSVYFGSENKIDVSVYNTLTMTIRSIPKRGNTRLGITSTHSGVSVSNGDWAAYTLVANGRAISRDTEISVDISNVSGEYYVGICTVAGADVNPVVAVITDFYLSA